jgi:hypothetical protein
VKLSRAQNVYELRFGRVDMHGSKDKPGYEKYHPGDGLGRGDLIMDGNGKPLIVYHGTQFPDAIDKFAPQGSWGGWNHVGTWFSSEKIHADRYAEVLKGVKPGSVYSANISIKNPLDKPWDDMTADMNAYMDSIGSNRTAKGSGQKWRRHLQLDGYDGLVIRNFLGDGPPEQTMYVPFETEQIKVLDRKTKP